MSEHTGNQMTNIMAMRRTVRTNIILRIGGSRRHWCQGLSVIKFIYLYGVCLSLHRHNTTHAGFWGLWWPPVASSCAYLSGPWPCVFSTDVRKLRHCLIAWSAACIQDKPGMHGNLVHEIRSINLVPLSKKNEIRSIDVGA